MSKVKSLAAYKSSNEHLTYIKTDIISLKSHPQFNENWLHEIIKQDPQILGLGDLDIRDHERKQPRAGRLDLLMEDADQKRRYTVEIQLGQTDESHLIRTIEYWDNERKRYPLYDHCAVIIAEDVTSRFLNVISLFNRHIPLIAIQVKALKVEGKVSLFFTKVLDEVEPGYIEDESTKEPERDRAFWENKASPETLKLVDDLHKDVLEIAQGYSLKYNRHYIGLHKDLRAHNFILFKPNKSNVNLALKCQIPEEMKEHLESLGIDVFKYNIHWKEHIVSLTPLNVETKKKEIVKLIQYAFNQYYEVE